MQKSDAKCGGIKLWQILSLVTTCCILAACTVDKVEGDKHTYTWQLQTPIIVGTVGLLLLVGGWFFRRQFGIVLIILALVCLVVVTPEMMLEHVQLSNTGFELSTGFWWAPTTHQVIFDDVAKVEEVYEKRGKHYHCYIICHKKSGAIEDINVSDLMSYAHADDKFLEITRHKGIPTEDKRPPADQRDALP